MWFAIAITIKNNKNIHMKRASENFSHQTERLIANLPTTGRQHVTIEKQ